MRITIDLDATTTRLLRRLARDEKRPMEEHARILLWQAVRREEATRQRYEASAKRQDVARLQ